ncbi:MAG TPA: DUF2809 domain-containing protein [Cytophagales bacterium]|nr:DUF2809 domain-containing protein [Cytophagales bacterium]HRG09258.1 DUF2809 domain-containing protein [Cyclobacteriaceae bacterium]
MLRLHKTYLLLTIFLFVLEVLIALFVHDNFIRPYVGDVLVVILMYCFVKSFLNAPALALASGVLVFAFAIEFLQYVKIVNVLGLEKSELMRTVLGTSFAWLDLLAYVVGIGIVLIAEKYIWQKQLV